MDEQGMMTTVETVRGAVTTWGIKAVGALVVLIVGLIAAKWIRASLRKALSKREIDATLVPFLSSLVYYPTAPAASGRTTGRRTSRRPESDRARYQENRA